MKKIMVICNAGSPKKKASDGQTVKSIEILNQLRERYGFENVDLFNTSKGLLSFFCLLPYVFRYMKKSDSIVLIPGPRALWSIVPLIVILNLFYGKKLFHVAVGGWLPKYVKRHCFINYIERRMTKIYVQTKGMKDGLEQLAFCNVEILRNFKSLRMFSGDTEYKDGSFRFVFFSRIIKAKGLKLAVEALKKVRDLYGVENCSLDIYGEMPEADRMCWMQYFSTLPDYICYKGVVEFDRSVDCLNKYYALLFPSYYEGEGFPGVFIDSLYSGVPIIASDWLYNAEFIDVGVNGLLFESKNKEDLIQKILWSLSHKEEWNVMRRKCLNYALKYQPQVAIEPLLKGIES